MDDNRRAATTAPRLSRRAFARGATASGAVAVATYVKPSLTPLRVPRGLAVSGPTLTKPPLTYVTQTATATGTAPDGP